MTDTKEEIARLEAELLPLKHRRVLERMGSRDGTIQQSDGLYAMAWAITKILDWIECV